LAPQLHLRPHRPPSGISLPPFREPAARPPPLTTTAFPVIMGGMGSFSSQEAGRMIDSTKLHLWTLAALCVLAFIVFVTAGDI